MSQTSDLDKIKRLHEMVGEILYWVWDPLGVNYTFSARSEYESYVPGVVKILLMEGPDQEKADDLIHHLEHLAIETMGLSIAIGVAQEAAERLWDDLESWKSAPH